MKYLFNKNIVLLFYCLLISIQLFSCSPVYIQKVYKIVNNKLQYGSVYQNYEHEKRSEIFKEIQVMNNVDISSFAPVDDSKINSFRKKTNDYFDIVTFESIVAGNYFKDKNFIYCAGKVVANADVSTFKVLNAAYGMAIDKNHIYFNGKISDENFGLHKIDTTTFKFYDQNIATDTNNLYHKGKYIGENKSFNKIAEKGVMSDETSCGYTIRSTIYKNENSIFVDGNKIDADVSTFKVKRWIVYVLLVFTDKYGEHEYTYGKGKYNPAPEEDYLISNGFYQTYDKIYFKWYKDYKQVSTSLPKANPEKISIYNEHIAYDDKTIFVLNFDDGRTNLSITTEPYDASSFEWLDAHFAKDKNKVYCFSEDKLNTLVDMIPSETQMLNDRVGYDKGNLFYYDDDENKLVLVTIDKKSFKILNKNYGVDKEVLILFYDNKFELINSFDTKSIVLINENLIKSNDGLFINYDNGFYYLKTDGRSVQFIGDSTYIKDKSKVYKIGFGFEEIKNADPATFAIINESYTKDIRHIYHRNDLVYNANPATFQILERGYAKDDQHVFFDEYTIDEANPATFQILETNYAKDDKHLFAYHHPLKNVDKNTFQILNSVYSKDKDTIYYYYYPMKNVDYKSFKILAEGLAIDKNNLYQGQDIVDIKVDIKTFELLKYNFAKDKNQVYFMSQYGIRIIQKADPKTFKPLGFSKEEETSYAQDEGYFFENERITSESELSNLVK